MSQSSIAPGVSEKSATVASIIPSSTLIILGALMLGETTINYIDRQIVSVLAPTLRAELAGPTPSIPISKMLSCLPTYFAPSDFGTVYGFAGTGSTAGSALATWGVGRALDLGVGYAPVFIGISLLMPIAMIAVLSLMGHVKPVESLATE